MALSARAFAADHRPFRADFRRFRKRSHSADP
jgi:hypothetical protein